MVSKAIDKLAFVFFELRIPFECDQLIHLLCPFTHICSHTLHARLLGGVGWGEWVPVYVFFSVTECLWELISSWERGRCLFYLFHLSVISLSVFPRCLCSPKYSRWIEMMCTFSGQHDHGFSLLCLAAAAMWDKSFRQRCLVILEAVLLLHPWIFFGCLCSKSVWFGRMLTFAFRRLSWQVLFTLRR